MCMWALVVHVAVLTISEQRAVGIMGFWNIAMEPWSGNSRVTADLTVLLCVLSKSNVERPYTFLRRGCKGTHIFGPLLLCLFIVNKNKLVRQSAGYSSINVSLVSTVETTYRLFRLPGHDLAGREGGWRRDRKHAQSRKVQFLIQFTVTCHNSRTINWIGSSYPGVLVRLCAVRLRSDYGAYMKRIMRFQSD